MINILEKHRCCGCSACESICPRQAVTMEEDEEGFLYPKVNPSLCVNCSLCNKTCPLEDRTSAHTTVISAYAAKHRNTDVLMNSSSGGMFTALSDYIMSVGGCVYGAAFDDRMVVRHQRAVTHKERDRMRGSKYVQSDARGIFPQVKKDLAEGKNVLFTGTPCQVDSLKYYLNGKTEGLSCCDLICYGTPSPLILKEHFSFISKKNRSQLTDYSFRPKRWGWHIHREIALFENGKEYYRNAYIDLWRNIYYSRLAMRPACHACRYTSLSRPGDITIGDCRGIDALHPEFGSYEGISLVLVNTQKGKEFLNKIQDQLIIKEIPIAKVMQPPLQYPCKKNSKRDEFWAVYNKRGYQAAIKRIYGRFYNLKYCIKNIRR